jgi:hypothetical protein
MRVHGSVESDHERAKIARPAPDDEHGTHGPPHDSSRDTAEQKAAEAPGQRCARARRAPAAMRTPPRSSAGSTRGAAVSVCGRRATTPCACARRGHGKVAATATAARELGEPSVATSTWKSFLRAIVVASSRRTST